MWNWNPKLTMLKVFSLEQSTSVWISVGNGSFCLTDYRKMTVKKKGFFLLLGNKRFFPHQKLQFLRNNIKQIRKSEQKKPSSIINQQWWAEEQHWGQWDGTWVQNTPLLETSERWGIVFKTSRFTSLSSCTCKWDWFGEDRILFQDQQ